MNRVYTITFTDGPNMDAVTNTAKALTANGVPVQDQGGRSVSFRVSGPTPEARDRAATYATHQARAWFPESWELATGMGVHRRVLGTGSRS